MQDATAAAVVDLLLRRGAKMNAAYPNHMCPDYMTPLALAFQSRKPALVKLLIGEGDGCDAGRGRG
jgi:hypothetical protein